MNISHFKLTILFIFLHYFDYFYNIFHSTWTITTESRSAAVAPLSELDDPVPPPSNNSMPMLI